MLKSANFFDFLILGIYFVTMIFCGVFLSRTNKNDKDFFKGGSKIPWPMVSLSIFICAFSAYMFVAAAGQTYKAGLPAFVIYLSTSLPYFFIALYFAKLYRRTRVTSPMEYVEMRFGGHTKALMTFLQIPVVMLLAGNMLYVSCIFLSSALGIKSEFNIFGLQISGLHLIMVITGLVVMIYTVTGGLLAIVVTDSVQFIIVMVASTILAVYSVKFFSQDGALMSNLQHYIDNPPHAGYFHAVNEFQPLSFTLAWIALQIFTLPGNMQVVQRSICVPDESAAKKSFSLATIFFIVCPIIWLLPVFLLRDKLPDMNALWPHLKNPTEASYVTIALQVLPNGMIGLVVSAILAASISTLAGCYNVVSVVWTRDIYAKYIAINADTKKLMIIGRISSVIIGLLAIAVGLMLAGFSDAFKTTFTIVSLTTVAISCPIMMGMIFRRTPQWAAFAAIILCLITTGSIEFIVPLINSIKPNTLCETVKNHSFEFKVFGSIFVTLATFQLSRFFYKPAKQSPATIKLFELLDKPIGEDEKSEPIVILSNLRAYKVVGLSLVAFGLPLALCKLFNVVNDPQNINLLAGLCFLGLSGLIFWLTSMRYSPIKIVRLQKNIIGQVGNKV